MTMPKHLYEKLPSDAQWIYFIYGGAMWNCDEWRVTVDRMEAIKHTSDYLFRYGLDGLANEVLELDGELTTEDLNFIFDNKKLYV